METLHGHENKFILMSINWLIISHLLRLYSGCMLPNDLIKSSKYTGYLFTLINFKITKIFVPIWRKIFRK